jgi:hypothetical protein
MPSASCNEWRPTSILPDGVRLERQMVHPGRRFLYRPPVCSPSASAIFPSQRRLSEWEMQAHDLLVEGLRSVQGMRLTPKGL